MQAAAARAHAARVSDQATDAASQAHSSATTAAQEISNLADRLGLTVSARGQQHQAAALASDATLACNTGIAQAQAGLIPVPAAQALCGVDTEDRGVAWSTIGPTTSNSAEPLSRSPDPVDVIDAGNDAPTTIDDHDSADMTGTAPQRPSRSKPQRL